MEKLIKAKRINPIEFFTKTKKMIEQMTEVTNNHYLVPEISLRLITPNCDLWLRNPENCPFPDPFWAFYWPGGQALTRFLLDNQSIIKRKSVLDLGCGCGAISIAAAKLGVANQIIANDIDPVAGVAVKLNTSLNHCEPNQIEIATEDFVGTNNKFKDVDCILLGDMFYDPEFSEKLMKWLLQFLRAGADIYIGDPGRYSSFYERYKKYVFKVAEYKMSDEFRKTNDLLNSEHIHIWKMSC